jgi:hypothetical protein
MIYVSLCPGGKMCTIKEIDLMPNIKIRKKEKE